MRALEILLLALLLAFFVYWIGSDLVKIYPAMRKDQP